MNWEELLEIHRNIPEPQPVFFRLYHDAQGVPLFYSMQDLPGTYIEVDAQAYARNSMRVRVRDGRLVEWQWRTTARLEPADSGTPCHPQDVCVVVTPDKPHQCWRLQTHETS